MTAARTELQALLDAALADGTQTYDHPAEIVALPCVSIAAADPWLAPSVYGPGFATTWELACEVPRTNPRQHYTALESLLDDVIGALLPSRWRIQSVSPPGERTRGDTTSMAATVTVTTKLQGGFRT